MSFKTVILSSLENYVASCANSAEYPESDLEERKLLLLKFPYPVMLELSFAEHDNANRWCWRQFGPNDGPCCQDQSEYRVCHIEGSHEHAGVWTLKWFEKTEYNFGFCEWYFGAAKHAQALLEFVPCLDWGENYPKPG